MSMLDKICFILTLLVFFKLARGRVYHNNCGCIGAAYIPFINMEKFVISMSH